MTTILVTGATGKVGRRLVDALLARGVAVRTLTRAPAAARLPAGVDVRVGDLADPASVAAAAAGADAAFLLWPGFSSDGAPAVAAALGGEVPHVVHLSAGRADRTGATAGVWADVEDAVRGAVGSSAFVRAGGFAANTLGWADQVRAGDVVRVPFLAAARSLVHEQDLADVAARCLLDAEHRGAAYLVTGPETLSQRDQVAAIGAALGRELRAEELTPDRAVAELVPLMGEAYATSSVAYWGSLVDDPEPVGPDAERVLGRPARTFAAWARDHAGDFA